MATPPRLPAGAGGPPQMRMQPGRGAHMPPPPPPAAGPSIIDTLISLVPVRVAGSATSADGPISFATPDGAPPAGFDASDLARTNELARLMLQNPTLSVPPLPSQPGPNMRSAKVARAKEDGNSHFRKGEFADAVRLYTLSADLAATRPVCEANVYARDELALALCNRSAAYASLGEHINALVDADAVLQLKRNWPKGHFRKGKALAGAGRLDEARESYLLGLQFDPSNEDLKTALREHDLQTLAKAKADEKSTAPAEAG